MHYFSLWTAKLLLFFELCKYKCENLFAYVRKMCEIKEIKEIHWTIERATLAGRSLALLI